MHCITIVTVTVDVVETGAIHSLMRIENENADFSARMKHLLNGSLQIGGSSQCWPMANKSAHTNRRPTYEPFA